MVISFAFWPYFWGSLCYTLLRLCAQVLIYDHPFQVLYNGCLGSTCIPQWVFIFIVFASHTTHESLNNKNKSKCIIVKLWISINWDYITLLNVLNWTSHHVSWTSRTWCFSWLFNFTSVKGGVLFVLSQMMILDISKLTNNYWKGTTFLTYSHKTSCGILKPPFAW